EENDDWGAAVNQSDILAAIERTHAFGLEAQSRDAALLVTLAPGIYTAHIDDPTGQGITLAEIYDASEGADGNYQRLVNISTRGHVGVGEQVLIGGFIVAGNSPKRVLVRAVGPGLTALGVEGALVDPNLRIVDRTG